MTKRMNLDLSANYRDSDKQMCGSTRSICTFLSPLARMLQRGQERVVEAVEITGRGLMLVQVT